MDRSHLSQGFQIKYQDLVPLIQENEDFFSNGLVQSFFQKIEHQYLLERTICHSEKAAEALNTAFKQYYATIRLTSQLSHSIRRHAIRFDQRRNKDNQHHLLILDKPLDYASDTVTHLDLIADNIAVPIDKLVIEQSNQLENQIESPTLYFAIRSLTPRQRYILEAAYLFNLKDTEIAEQEGVSQQFITKTRRKALSKIKLMVQDKTI
ncbi:sigma-70 family RNA polymerase sigma factor [Halobacillus naozhouensis]|uniref:Sigma-70 family RNA polymerase sigma factor n=1 Tax=Halobacillus naozhouensis TaxID=554880 RepID=A0ABY8IXW7_9BACI|nr:sigma-70 family RNA polymerase sigma factor [Halobacillus naozhouensis]WFT75063.1 sigma-70 family RNA polymerase sigma factor [Halobacillus naozhouensis]